MKETGELSSLSYDPENALSSQINQNQSFINVVINAHLGVNFPHSLFHRFSFNNLVLLRLSVSANPGVIKKYMACNFHQHKFGKKENPRVFSSPRIRRLQL